MVPSIAPLNLIHRIRQLAAAIIAGMLRVIYWMLKAMLANPELYYGLMLTLLVYPIIT
jgi:hypothetical protein